MLDRPDIDAKGPRPGSNTYEFAGSELLFDQAMAQTRMAVCMTDPKLGDNPIVFANEAFLELTGYSMNDVMGRNCRFLQGAKTDPRHVQYLRDAIADEKTVVVEILNYKKSGEPFWNALHLGPIYDEDGGLLYYFGSQWDVSEVYAARQETRHSRALARELSHRLKNVFGVLSSVVSISGRREQARGITDRIGDRVAALGRAYDASVKGKTIRGEVDIENVIDRVLSAYDPLHTGRYATNGPTVFVPDRTLSVLGLALHELATNAVKHGAWSVEGGKVDITWTEEDDVIDLRWCESGGPAVAEPALASGTGTSILETLVDSIRGDIVRDVKGGGLCVDLKLPLEDGSFDG